MIVIDQRQLSVVTELGAGRFGTVYRVHCTDPRLPGELAFRAADLELDTAQQVLVGMHEAVSMRDQVASHDLAELDSHTTWPLAMVARDGRAVGCVTQIIDRDYYLDARSGDGGPGLRLFDVQLLCASGEQLAALGVTLPAADDALVRLALMSRLAYAVEIIHRPRGTLRLVYGDLNLRNVAVATNPPRTLLLSCDGVAKASDTKRVQANTPFFVPPEIADGRQKLQDQITDIYKLGLCITRGLSAGRGASQVADPASPLVLGGLLDRAGIHLLTRAVGADRSGRPTAEEIKDYLIGRILDLADGQG